HHNLSCAYNTRWVCPPAPGENRLDVRIEVGELDYRHIIGWRTTCRPLVCHAQTSISLPISIATTSDRFRLRMSGGSTRYCPTTSTARIPTGRSSIERLS